MIYLQQHQSTLPKMKIVFASARKCQQFAAIFANLKNFTDNVCIYFKGDYLYIQCLDDSHCSLFETRLSAEWFKEYTFDEVNDLGCIGVNIGMLNKVLNTWTDTQEMSIEVEPDTDKISINYENGNTITNQFNKYFELSLVNVDNTLMDVQLFNTLVDLTLESKVFCALINQLSIFDNNLTLTFNEDNIECVSSGSEGSMKALINIHEVKEYAISEGTTLKQSYSLRYVQMMCQFNKLATEIEMGFSAESPMTMKYLLGDNNDPNSFARIHLAPKILDEDDN